MSITTKTQQDIVNAVIAQLIANNVELSDYNIGSVLRTIVEALAEKLGFDGDTDSLYQQLNTVYLNSRIDTATEDALEQLGALIGVTRFTGGNATGNVTFRIEEPLVTNLTIAANTQVGTQPNDENGQKIFNVTDSTTFYSSVNAESHIFVDGVYDYPLDQRFIDEISGLSGVSGGSNFVFTEGLDFEQSDHDDYIIDTSEDITEIDLFENVSGYLSNEITSMDACDATTDWTVSGTNTVALNTTAGERKEGTGCLNLVKSDNTSAKMTVYKTLATGFNIANQEVNVWYYVYDPTKISTVKVIAGQDASNFYHKDYTIATSGWTRLAVKSTDTGYGSPSTSNVDFVALDITTDASGTTFSGNQQRMDYWFEDSVMQLNSALVKEGTYSASPIKSSTSYAYVYFDKNITQSSIYGQSMSIWMKVLDTTAKNKIDKIEFYLGNTSSNVAFIYTIDKDDIETGWKNYYLTAYKTVGSPSASIIDFVRIKIYTINSSDTFAYNDILFDYWVFGTLTPWEGEVIKFLEYSSGSLPDDGSTFRVSYVPLSWEVNCTADTVGSVYNVSKDKINYKVSYIPEIDSVNNYEALTGGTDEETDEALRIRIKANSVAGRATVNSLKTAIENIERIRSANVIELPEKIATSEPHLYVSGTDSYTMNYDIILDDANWVISGVSGGSGITFVKDTDYTISPENNTVVWGASGSVAKPDASSIFYSSYHYEHLGHVQIYVAGEEIPMSLNTSGLVDDAIENYKAGGIVVAWEEPTIKYIPVTAEITLEEGYSFSTLQSQVESAISSYISSLSVGDDVLLNKVVAAIMNVTGIANTVINDIGGGGATDYTIGDNEIAKPSTLTITES